MYHQTILLKCFEKHLFDIPRYRKKHFSIPPYHVLIRSHLASQAPQAYVYKDASFLLNLSLLFKLIVSSMIPTHFSREAF